MMNILVTAILILAIVFATCKLILSIVDYMIQRNPFEYNNEENLEVGIAEVNSLYKIGTHILHNDEFYADQLKNLADFLKSEGCADETIQQLQGLDIRELKQKVIKNYMICMLSVFRYFFPKVDLVDIGYKISGYEYLDYKDKKEIEELSHRYHERLKTNIYRNQYITRIMSGFVQGYDDIIEVIYYELNIMPLFIIVYDMLVDKMGDNNDDIEKVDRILALAHTNPAHMKILTNQYRISVPFLLRSKK